MSTLRVRPRYKCSDCGNDCRVEPVEMMLHHKGRVYGYWEWISATLCPPCKVVRYDWWKAMTRGELAVKA